MQGNQMWTYWHYCSLAVISFKKTPIKAYFDQRVWLTKLSFVNKELSFLFSPFIVWNQKPYQNSD